jgi:hypothetical protein
LCSAPILTDHLSVCKLFCCRGFCKLALRPSQLSQLSQISKSSKRWKTKLRGVASELGGKVLAVSRLQEGDSLLVSWLQCFTHAVFHSWTSARSTPRRCHMTRLIASTEKRVGAAGFSRRSALFSPAVGDSCARSPSDMSRFNRAMNECPYEVVV